MPLKISLEQNLDSADQWHLKTAEKRYRCSLVHLVLKTFHKFIYSPSSQPGLRKAFSFENLGRAWVLRLALHTPRPRLNFVSPFGLFYQRLNVWPWPTWKWAIQFWSPNQAARHFVWIFRWSLATFHISGSSKGNESWTSIMDRSNWVIIEGTNAVLMAFSPKES